VAFPEWFVGPPLVGAASQAYIVYEATTAAQAAKYVSDGYKGPYATQAAAQAQATTRQTAAQSTEGPTIPSLGSPLTGINAIGAFFSDLGNSNTWIRVAKVVIGGLLLIIGIVHITGAGGAIADTARKVPLPV
jgi:uncharacterized membrane protein